MSSQRGWRNTERPIGVLDDMWIAPHALLLGIGCLIATSCALPDTPPSTASAPPTECGVEQNVHGEGLDPVARQCLLDAFLAGEAAVFVERSVTDEGDPIIRTFRTHGIAPVELTHDARQDSFGSGRIELIACERLLTVAEWNAATGAGMPEDFVFVQDGCEQVGTR